MHARTQYRKWIEAVEDDIKRLEQNMKELKDRRATYFKYLISEQLRCFDRN